MNSTEIFKLALGLSSPWYVEKVSFLSSDVDNEQELHLYINFEKGFKFKSSDGASSTAYDTVDKTWQHLSFFQHRCYLHARVPRIRNKDKKTVEQISVPWARENSGFTLLFEAYAMLLIESEMPVNKVSTTVKCTAPRIWRVFDFWINRAVSKDDLSDISQIGMDETSRKKGHNYVTAFVDLNKSRVIHVTEGKDANTIKSFVSCLEEKGGKRENINVLSMDMSPAFIKGAMENLPNAQIVFDKFHLIQSLNKSLDEVRRLERKGNELLSGHRYTILKKYNKLSRDKKETLHELLWMYPKLGEAYKLRELFNDIFSIEDPQEAKGYLWFWCNMAMESGIEPFKKFVSLVKSHWSGISAYFDKQVTNGVLEGINSKIQLAKRRARGYRKTENFINMIYFISGKLKFDYPRFSL